ncbi:MAG TPA: DUF4384 domain-containing protein [Blastocatellia bacterium]|nr:DUF4384 domain-containing protein [Blastocatellia bacterium]
MKQSIKLTLFSMLTAAVVSGAGAAQVRNNLTADADGARARGLFVSKKADAMRVVILKEEGGSLVPIDPSRSFTKGDQIKVSFQSNFQGYVYIVNVTPGGKKCVLFPYGAEVNSISSGQRYDLPQNGTIEFDEEKGTEVLQVIMARERIPHFDAAVKESGGCLGESAASAAAELASNKTGIVTGNSANALADKGIRARSIILAPGKDKDQEGSVVAISTKNGGGRLKDKEAAIFEIHLQHN